MKKKLRIKKFPDGGTLKPILIDEFKSNFINSNENIQRDIIKNDGIKNSELYQKQLVLKAINEAEEANREKYEPSQSVKNTKAGLAATQLLNPTNFYLNAVNTGGDLYTAIRYGIDGQYDKAKEDLIQAGINWLPFLKGKLGMKQGTYNLSNLDKLINLGISGTQKASDIKTITETKELEDMKNKINKKKYGNHTVSKFNDGGWNNSTQPRFNLPAPRLTGMGSNTQPTGFTGMGNRTQPTGATGMAPSPNPSSYSWGTQASAGAPSTVSAFGQTQGTGDYLNSSLSGVASSMGTITGYNPDATKATGYNKDVRNFNKFQKASTSTGTKVGRGIGIAALNFIPFVGPLIAGIGAPAVDAMVEGRRKQLREKAQKSLDAQNNVEDANSQELTLNPQMAHGGNYTGGPVQLETNETLLRQLPNGGTQLERFNLPTHEQSGEVPNTYMNKADYAASPNLGYSKTGQLTLNPKEVKMTFADKTKKIESRFKRNHADPIADKTKEMALSQVKQDNELLKSAIEQAQTSKMMYGGNIPKYTKGGYREYQDSNNPNINIRPRKVVNNGVTEFVFDELEKSIPMKYSPELDSPFQQPTLQGSVQPVPSITPELRDYDIKALNRSGAKYNPQYMRKVLTKPQVNTPTTKTEDKSKLGLTAGDYTQLAAGLPSIAYSLAMEAKKPEVERFGRDLTPIREQVIAKDYNPLIMAQNAGMATLNDSTNAASRNANLISLISNVTGEKAKYSLATDTQNAGLARQRDQLLSGQRQANIGIGMQEKDVNARNRAARQHQTAKAFDLMTQTGFNLGKSLQTKEENNMKYNSLNSLAANYDLLENNDGTITFKKKAVTKQRYGGYLKKNK